MSNTAWAFTAKILQLVSGFVTVVLLARMLDLIEFGLLSLFISLFIVSTQLSTVGARTIFIRYTSGASRGFTSRFFLPYLLSKFMLLALLLLALVLYGVSKGLDVLFLLLAGVLSFGTVLEVFEWKCEAIYQQKTIALAKLKSTIVALALKVLVIYSQMNYQWILVISVLELSLHLIVLLGYSGDVIVKRMAEYFRGSLIRARVIFLLKRTYPLFISQCFILLYNRIDQLMIVELADAEQLALYSVALRFSEPFNVFCMAICSTALPYLSGVYRKDKKEYAMHAAGYVTLLVALSIVILTFLLLTGSTFIALIFGNKYSGAEDVLLFLALSVPFSFLAMFNGILLVVIGMQKLTISRSIYALIINVILNLLLIPHFAAVGAAIATALTLFLSGVVFYSFTGSSRSIFKINMMGLYRVNLVKNIKL